MNGNVRDVILSEEELYSGNFMLRNDENNDHENIITRARSLFKMVAINIKISHPGQITKE